jgi:hypothetical protein
MSPSLGMEQFEGSGLAVGIYNQRSHEPKK